MEARSRNEFKTSNCRRREFREERICISFSESQVYFLQLYYTDWNGINESRAAQPEL